MVRSEFLSNSSMPPETFRSSSVTRSLRSSSIAPARNAYRSSSIAPNRAASVLPDRISYRSASVAPAANRLSNRLSSAVRATSVAPVRASSVSPSSLSFRSSSVAPLARSIVDTTLPSRQFGSRLQYQKIEKNVNPVIYDEYYGTNYVPSGGRDSWSAYRISDETLDDNDELVYHSALKDHEVMKRVNKQIVRAQSVPPPQFIPVAPATRRFAPKPIPQIINVTRQVNAYGSRPVYRAASVDPGLYRVGQPRVKVAYSTVNDSSELLSAKEKVLASQTVEINKPSVYQSLKERLNAARTNMDRTRLYISRYSNPDNEMSKIDAEVKAIKNRRILREQNSYNDILQQYQPTSDLRRRIKATLRKSRLQS